MEVPPDIYQVILSYCDVAEVLSTGITNRSVYDLSALDLVWRPFYRDRWEGGYSSNEPVNEGLSFRDMVSVVSRTGVRGGWRAVRAALLPRMCPRGIRARARHDSHADCISLPT